MAVSIAVTGVLLITGGLFQISTGSFGGQTESEIISVFFAAFIIAVIVNGFNCRAMDGKMPSLFSDNPIFFFVMGGIAAVQVIIVQFGGAIFGTVPLTATEGVTIVLAAALPVLVLWFIIRSAFAWHRSRAKIPAGA